MSKNKEFRWIDLQSGRFAIGDAQFFILKEGDTHNYRAANYERVDDAIKKEIRNWWNVILNEYKENKI